ncbi:inositol monophosphatase family protein [Mangrovibacillus cuniculi]|uniref:inositol-phosphate phosphatase n=1 Tax=Mangrovibacillus cuniculi TaxID=2593652 RepID=A0A7S8CA29_9BACI|nr:inositol monophosphatase family protein [Mangrovibacillus cuniculi]QPC46202.1 inositol monophosphatase family protein [Mangrovibacillus cuniculi]
MDWSMVDQLVQKWLVEARGRILTSLQQRLTIESKSNANDLVTNIDRETEQFFIEKVKDHFPNHRLLGEEGFGDDVQTLEGIVWIVDPIDGTMNFVHQQRNFAISIGIYEEGVGKLGYIYDVMNDELYHAENGKGAFYNGEQLPILQPVELKEAIVGLNTTWVVPNKRVNHERLIPIVKQARGTRSYGSAALEMAYIAVDTLDAYITMRLSPWDFAAGMVILKELGGICTNLEGKPLSLTDSSPVVVARPGLHDELMNIINR